MDRTYKIKTDKHQTTITLSFLGKLIAPNLFQDIFAIDPAARMIIALYYEQPFVIHEIKRQPAESLATLTKTIEAAGFVKEAKNV